MHSSLWAIPPIVQNLRIERATIIHLLQPKFQKVSVWFYKNMWYIGVLAKALHLFFNCCVTNYHKRSGLKQHTFCQFLWVRSSDPVQLYPLINLSQSCNLGVFWILFLSRVQSLWSSSHNYCQNSVLCGHGLEVLVSCWLPASYYYSLSFRDQPSLVPRHVTISHTLS